MDFVLQMADDLVLDRFWAWAVPALPRSLANAGSSHHAVSNTIRSSKVAGARPSSSTTSNFTSHLSNAWASNATSGMEALDGVSAWGRDHLLRQCLSLYAITFLGILLLYFSFAGFSYYFVFNHDMKNHPRFLKNQVKLEIQCSLRAFAPLDLLTLPWFIAEVRGHSMLYENISDYGLAYAIFSIPFFLVFTDACIYWVHRLEHHPRLYKHIHKPHHKWLVPTPFASHAFHPLDGYAQSLPYHIFVFLFPLHRFIYIGLFVFVNCWSILIHDSDMICNSPLEKVINGPSHHTLHHLYFNVNYGQYFTGCDRLGGSYRAPKAEDDPLLDVGKEVKKSQ
ncbi:putative sterol delta 5,6-desaturase [Meira miltonrushii]|uniref:Putative sterol delta 5,6-desaturase n=1 Tax=Meira miltonrushii TaxID=1280837 RepID=A0A316V5D2_9BASI|nr:putative sterol delta 5,6-desaturase [Meira miltonrushii]PWN32464.1 putative sterol delta 5,6-desaturase [Meira miltonrushii]